MCLYASPNDSIRVGLWVKLRMRFGMSNEDWMVIGDLNDILSNAEMEGGPAREDGALGISKILSQNVDFWT